MAAKAIEYMIIDAILEAEPTMKIAEQVDKPEKYVYLTDDIMQRIEMTTNPVRVYLFCIIPVTQDTSIIRSWRIPAQYLTAFAHVTFIKWSITRSSAGNIRISVVNISLLNGLLTPSTRCQLTKKH